MASLPMQQHVQDTLFHVKDAHTESHKAQIQKRPSSDSSSRSSFSPRSRDNHPYPMLMKRSDIRRAPKLAQKYLSGSGSLRPEAFAAHVVFQSSDSSVTFESQSDCSGPPSPVACGSSAKLSATSGLNAIAAEPLDCMPGLWSQGVPHGLSLLAGNSTADSDLGHLQPAQEPRSLAEQAQLGQEVASDTSEQVRANSLAAALEQAHATGTCVPCIFWLKNACAKENCKYCHFEHTGKRTTRCRPSKKTRDQRKAAVLAGAGDQNMSRNAESRASGVVSTSAKATF